MLCMWSARPHRHQVCTQVQDPNKQWAINLAGTRTKSKIIAEYQAQQHSHVVVPSSDGATVTIIMTQLGATIANYSN